MAEERGSIILNFTVHVKSITSDCLSQTVTTPGRYSTSTSPKNYRFTCELEEGYKISRIDFVDGTGGNNSLSGFTDNTFTISISAPSGMLCAASIFVSEGQKAQKFISLDNLARFKAKCDETYAKTGEGGGITKSTVIEHPNSLPTATADSPDFVQTPDGKLYRKKAVEGGSLLGTWVFNDTIPFLGYNSTYNISFNSYNQNFTSMTFEYGGDPRQGTEYSIIKYGAAEVARGDNGADILFGLSENKTFEITDVSSLSDEAEFESFITTIATKTGGGASVTYSYVPQQDAIYNHNIEVRLSGQNIDTTGKTLSVYFTIQNNSQEQIDYAGIVSYLNTYPGRIVAVAESNGALDKFNNAEVKGTGFLLYGGEFFIVAGFLSYYNAPTYTVDGASIPIVSSTFTINVIDTVSKA